MMSKTSEHSSQFTQLCRRLKDDSFYYLETNIKQDYTKTMFMKFQSQKIQGFCVADFATLSDETRSRSKIFPLFIRIKEPCVRNLKGSNVRNYLGFRKLIYTIYEKRVIEHLKNKLTFSLDEYNFVQEKQATEVKFIVDVLKPHEIQLLCYALHRKSSENNIIDYHMLENDHQNLVGPYNK